MKYNIKEIQEIIKKEIDIHITNNEFKNNSVYLEVIDKINSSLNNKRIIDFKVELNNIYIKLSDEDTNYSMSISTPDSKTIIYQINEEGKPHSIMYENYSYKDNFFSKVEALPNNYIVIHSTNQHLESESVPGVYNLSGNISDKIYNQYGILINDTYLKLPSHSVIENEINKISKADMDNYVEKYTLERNTFDTARFKSESKEDGVTYNGIIFLNQKFGLKEMNISSHNKYPRETIISPLSREEIDNIISKETNEQVRKGLEELSLGRENYSYNSNYDEDFTCIINPMKTRR